MQETKHSSNLETRSSITGGVWIDALSATYPFATLTISPQKLELRVKIGFLGRLCNLPEGNLLIFRHDETTEITEKSFIPIIATGIQIHHKIKGYPDTIIFWQLSSSNTDLIQKLKSAGFNAG